MPEQNILNTVMSSPTRYTSRRPWEHHSCRQITQPPCLNLLHAKKATETLLHLKYGYNEQRSVGNLDDVENTETVAMMIPPGRVGLQLTPYGILLTWAYKGGSA